MTVALAIAPLWVSLKNHDKKVWTKDRALVQPLFYT